MPEIERGNPKKRGATVAGRRRDFVDIYRVRRGQAQGERRSRRRRHGITIEKDGTIFVSTRARVFGEGNIYVKVAMLLGTGIKVYDAFTYGARWLERLTGGEKRSDEIWAIYVKERDLLLAKYGATSRDVIADLRREFRRRYPAWTHLFN